MSQGAFVGGRIHTMVTPEATARAICWADGKIVAVGDDETVMAAARERGIEPQDIGGRVVLPGFVDAHMHFLHVGVKQMRPDLRPCTSLQEALDVFEAWLREHPGDEPVVAEGWDESDWPEDRFPTRQEIDTVARGAGTDRPLVMRRICGHIAVASSSALAPLRERWDRDDLVDLETGLVLEEASLYNNEVFPASPEMLREAIQIACQESHRIGVTAVGDYCQAPFRAAVLQAAEEEALSVRLFESIYVQQLEEAVAEGMRTGRRRGKGDWFRDGGLKVFLDGSFGGHTAYLREPYQDKPQTRGMRIWTDDEVDHWFKTAHGAGIQVHAHAIGDAAIDQGLDGFTRIKEMNADSWFDGVHGAADLQQPENPESGLRHRFEHFELPHDDTLERTRALGIWACSQPNFVGEWSDKGGMYEHRIGQLYRMANRFRSFQEAQVRFSFGSDGMPFGPLYGIQSSLEHPQPQERLTPEEAVWYYTNRAARSIFWEDAIGSLEPGKHADLLLLDRQDLEPPATGWVIRKTIVAGRTVHEATTPMPHAH